MTLLYTTLNQSKYEVWMSSVLVCRSICSSRVVSVTVFCACVFGSYILNYFPEGVRGPEHTTRLTTHRRTAPLRSACFGFGLS